MLSWYYTDYAGNKLDLKSDASKMSERNIDFKKFVKLYSKLPNDKRHDLIKVLGSMRQNNGRDINLCSRVRLLEELMLNREALKNCTVCDLCINWGVKEERKKGPSITASNKPNLMIFCVLAVQRGRNLVDSLLSS